MNRFVALYKVYQLYQVIHLLPGKPSEIAIDNGISRRIGGVLGIVFN